MKFEPGPYSVITSILQEQESTILFTIDKPILVPLIFIVHFFLFLLNVTIHIKCHKKNWEIRFLIKI